ncbi:MAG: tRNA (N(6)-L-threonylcarbamoyladenosine(37)-C(2))-methylthiotransferase MtaB [Anaerolineae bacterium]|nr:tRNA (N(6)-L-threonylcarbamoyladenosine(37)-C(2))-methylthiotransferase MtaB [Anaerolineae bacterium]
MTSRRIFLDFVGCRLNEAEIEQMARRFAGRGDVITNNVAEADVIVLNTCAVTKEAARKSRQMIAQAGRANPQAAIVATGCYAELAPERLSHLPGVTQVIGNRQKDNLIDLVSEDSAPFYEREPLAREILKPGSLGRTRAFVKVQDGCDNRCTFCITTVLRGKGRSRSPDAIIEEINLLAGAGYQEIVLTGVHLGSYGHDLGQLHGLRELVEALLSQTNVSRLRLSSLEPWDLDAGFFDLWADPRLCPHIHLPLQSGCDATLRRMARRTTQEAFAALVTAARARISDLAITADIIVGFPGETQAEFAESLAFVEAMGFARLHVFTYSSRPGTAAARMPNHVPKAIKKERSAHMLALSKRLWMVYQQEQIGRVYDVLWESAYRATPDGYIWSGLTGNYLRVFTTTSEMLNNTITPARLTGLTGDGLRAVVA